jgi:hypothetical protein
MSSNPPSSSLRDWVSNGIDALHVMLNQVLNLIQDLQFQHLIGWTNYETLKRVQGDKKRIATSLLAKAEMLSPPLFSSDPLSIIFMALNVFKYHQVAMGTELKLPLLVK